MVRYNYLVPIVAKPCFTFSYLGVSFIDFLKEKTPQSIEITAFLSGVDKKDAGAKPCVARVCGLLRLDFPFCNSNPQHLVMTDE